jgi:hypothetical protein
VRISRRFTNWLRRRLNEPVIEELKRVRREAQLDYIGKTPETFDQQIYYARLNALDEAIGIVDAERH